jgi:archaellum component FlaG (FlaF/FlaG flagellin family)
MSSICGNGSRGRKRVSGVLYHGGRGLNILTDGGDLWVLDLEDVDPGLLGHRVTVEGTQSGYDRLTVEWIGESDLAN